MVSLSCFGRLRVQQKGKRDEASGEPLRFKTEKRRLAAPFRLMTNSRKTWFSTVWGKPENIIHCFY
ncbi:hypothetical protein JT31_19670 [Cedecea neteri]|uniref:Uncharacterized protein n=1 Tax=Cedecea neteri TaxID=158822 RepID=A0A089Q389_9ENTR|nr:hypothetical protein JT31_19670 [Cedecea neteri]